MGLAPNTHVADWRRALHAMPEPGFGEHRTAAFVAERLRSFGLDVHEGVGQTGVVATLKRGNGNRAIALRADMDALKILEATGLTYAAASPGFMHACGHDGHMAGLLGAAERLARGDEFSGTVVFIFQPNEEHGRGARAMLADGLLDRFPFEEIYGLHNMPGLEVGRFATRRGAIMAAEDNFEIVVRGKGGHAAKPQTANDPVVIAAQLILGLQTIVSRRIAAQDQAVVSITEILTDGTRNVLPQTVTLKGDARSYGRDVQAQIEARMRELGAGTAAAFGAVVATLYTHEFAPTINHREQADAIVEIARSIADAGSVDDNIAPMMGSEDFGVFLEHRPGAFAFFGNGTSGTNGQPLHHPGYDFNDAALGPVMDFWCALVTARLPP